MRKLFIIAMLFLFCACGSHPIPQWKDTASRQLESYKINFLADKEDATEPHFVKAKKAISSNNDLNLLAVLYLTKYALHTAALEDFDDSDFIRIDKLQTNTVNRAYFDLLKGNFARLNAGALPSNNGKLLPLMINKDLIAATREMASISDPLSRLIACGIWVKYLPYDESILRLAIDTAADNGWRRPLWAYLNTLQQYYLDRQETIKAKSTKERLELLKK
jgi:hypothetical protein